MTIARRKQVRLDVTPYYHCVTRCVRRAFLCGQDALTGRDFSHRRRWIEQHILRLSQAFCIDVAGYAVMSNHYHVVLHVDQDRANRLSDTEVINRWLCLYKGPEVIRRYHAGESLNDDEAAAVQETLVQWRHELTNISRFMGHLNERIARRANKEDNCKGRFWESRFRLQAILDVKALLQTLCYVDLNPIRAKMAKTIQDSRHTSIRQRLRKYRHHLMAFTEPRSTDQKNQPKHANRPTIPIAFKDYLALVDYTGRLIRKGKRGFISKEEPSILDVMGMTSSEWIDSSTQKRHRMPRALGGAEVIKQYCEAIGQRWVW